MLPLFQKWRWGKIEVWKSRTFWNDSSESFLDHRWVWVSSEYPDAFPSKKTICKSCNVLRCYCLLITSQWFSNCWTRNVHLEWLLLAPSNLTGVVVFILLFEKIPSDSLDSLQLCSCFAFCYSRNSAYVNLQETIINISTGQLLCDWL